jgi:general stress protein 26
MILRVLVLVILSPLMVSCVSRGSTAGSGAPVAAASPMSAAGFEVPEAELNLASDQQAVLDSARALMLTDPDMALVTMDSAGQPRVRTVRAFLDDPEPGRPERGMTVWIMTRLSTRKIEQIRRHPKVTLYFDDDSRVSYGTLMGMATVHTDPSHPGARRHYDEEYAAFFWPDFPRDLVMIEVLPMWLEYMGPGLWNDQVN